MNNKVKQKWVYENGVYFPIPGDTTLHSSPGNGVFQIYEQRGSTGSRLGLRKIAEQFLFDYKIYDLGAEDIMEKIERTWISRIFIESNHNLGVIFNGLKGTGKTIAAKILSNRLGIPVLIVPEAYNGLLEFISSLCIECVVLIDEAEKTFRGRSDVLLKLIDGMYNESRKLYVLTTNELSIDENLLGRPGRIRYIKQFGNLEVNALKEYINDNLIDKSKTTDVLKQVDLLEISTIDILKALIEEVNIHGEITDDSMLNIPRANYCMEILHFTHLNDEDFDDVMYYISAQSQRRGMTVSQWLKAKGDNGDFGADALVADTNEELLKSKFNCYCYSSSVAVNSPRIMPGVSSFMGEILSPPDQYGFFQTTDVDGNKCLKCLLFKHASPSLYGGSLQKIS